MNASDENSCERCGAAIPAAATDRLCPACLMSGALATASDETVSEAPGAAAAPLEFREFPVVFGNYRLLGWLGSGGMGTVYEAEQLATGRRVALKMLGQHLDSPELRQRFLREGRLAAGVNHPNSLYVFGSEEIDGLPVITMEIAGSGTLKDKLEKRGPLPVAQAVDSILDVIAGLEAAFAAGVLHRDVKPSNCFVDAEGRVKVGDFGLSVSTLAKDDSYVTATGVIMGTPAFAPPEQLRGDELDVRADIYSVGATLFTLLSGRAPFEGKNAVQVVANVVNSKPTPLTDLREKVPPGLARVVARCLSKQPEGRFADYRSLRDALLPFGSSEPEPASLAVRAAGGWIDYLIAFLVPYVPLMLAVGNDEFHLRLFMDRTLYSARYHLVFLACGILYFTIVEGIWGGGPGKRLRGLRVVRSGGRPPGIGRALIRILVPVLSIEGIRIPLLLATISSTRIDDMAAAEIVVYSVATFLCPCIPVLLSLRANRDNGFTTVWDLVSGTRVVVKPKGAVRPSIESLPQPVIAAECGEALGPYRVLQELVPGRWLVATDPLLRRPVWLLRRSSSELSLARRTVARSGRLRWLQKVETTEATWDAFEATPGVPFTNLVEDGRRVPWATLRLWLHDLASELWLASGDRTLPSRLGLDHLWVTAQGHLVLLDEPWPGVHSPSETIPVEDLAGQQRFLSAVAARVDTTGLPLHARPVLQNLEEGKFEKLSFFTGILRGMLDKPAEVGKGIRAGSIFMLPLYTAIMIFVGAYQGADWLYELIGSSAGRIAMATTLFVLAANALAQLLTLPFHTSPGHAVFRLAVIDHRGRPADRARLLARWAIAWLPLLLPLAIVTALLKQAGAAAFISTLVLVVVWIGGAAWAAAQPARGLHDRVAGTWVVRR